jgi:molecular chaperone DnaK
MPSAGRKEAIAALREALAVEDTAGIRQRLEALSQALTRLGEGIHRAAAAGDQAATGDEDVVDAEFEDVDQRRHG